jgi:transposase
MTSYAALDVSQETTAICVVDENGRIVAEKIVATCPDTIATWLLKHTNKLARVGLETGPLAVWLWNELREHDLPVICLDARHAHAALKMRSNKTDRNDAAGLAQIVRTGWFKQVQIKSRDSYEIRSLLSGREVLVRIRVKIENEIRGLLRTFGVLFGKTAGGFARRAQEIVAGDLDASPTMQLVIETLMRARAAILDLCVPKTSAR